MSSAAVFGLDPGTHARHELHLRPRAWPEGNCYVDLLIETLHAARLEPWACLGFTLASDFEGDQFAFFKPPPGDLAALYGVSVYELNLWRPLLEHALVQLRRGALLLAEVDAYYLPDTAGTDYRRAHVKTTIGIERVDAERRALGYFHNAGYFGLEGADFDGLFQLEPRVPDTHLPPYVELMRLPERPALAGPALAAASLELACAHLRRRPVQNPVARYRGQFAGDMQFLLGQDLETYHRYAFAVLRQLGANFELASLYLGWLGRQGEPGLEPAAGAFHTVSESAKALILKLARVVNSKRSADLSPLLDTMEAGWERGMSEVVAHLRP